MKIANALKMESNLVPILPEKKPATIPGGYYIKARCIQNSAIASAPPHVREIWDWLIKEAEYKPKQLKGTSLSRGQLFTDYAEIQEGLSWKEGFVKKSYQKHHVDYAMRWLREKEMITTQKTTRGLIITVCKYDLYQNPDNYKKEADHDTDTLTTGQTTPQKTGITTDEQDASVSLTVSYKDNSGNDYDSAKDTANDTASDTIAKEVKELKEDIGEKSAEAPPPPPPKKEKKKSFKTFTEQEFLDEVETYSDKYPRDMLTAFCENWTEKSALGKMKFQLKDTWETGKRLATWARNDMKWGNNLFSSKKQQVQKNSTPPKNDILKQEREKLERLKKYDY